ncbi:CNT family concentrative nucleoside transporter [Arcticibacter tournemirensis]|uniref:NupC/NupG family nucleoside CNT transporter n=1 Tax=Arcticibacter tournemirensis TaxID=699437 RepID=A0A5M9HBT6_9SPHI|nr:nucleoside transporter C-terminal domain-containing protein [Arcticibacter tournemirensis]KAA8482738.1 NupC/NupG family nucleoside CNT transporter [Arcticibacter tournemirensis]TQM51032.1 CNT family concentrative nucleoside transporter [Arcticibacter tournemirensis]
MERFTGIIGIVLIFAIAFLMSNNRKAINYRLVFSGIAIQLLLAVFILKVPVGKHIFAWLGAAVTKILSFSQAGADFVFGPLVNREFMGRAFGPGNEMIFFFSIIPTIIFVAVLVSVAYYLGIMQRIVKVFAYAVYKIMGVSGSEALSNIASAFVGQVEAQIMIKPYLKGMTMSELLASMTGSMACIAGGVMAVYISLGVPAEYLLAASIMAAPAALVISKIVWPETQVSETKGQVSLEIKKTSANLVDSISHGASDGLKVGLNVIAMLIGFIAIIALIDYVLGWVGMGLGNIGVSLSYIGIDVHTLNLKQILGAFFSIFAWAMGVPGKDIQTAGSLMGTKMVINEFVAYLDLAKVKGVIDPKTLIITSFALCGFANFSSIAIQVGGIGELAPERRTDLARLGVKALICGTLASYLSATIAGILL